MENVIDIKTRLPLPTAPAVTTGSRHPNFVGRVLSRGRELMQRRMQEIAPGMRLVKSDGTEGWIVFRICHSCGELAGFEVSRQGVRTFLRPEQVEGVMA